MKYSMLLLLMSGFALFACQPKSDSKTEGDSISKQEVKKKRLYSITPFAPSASFEDAGISSMNYSAGKFDFGIAGETYKLGLQTPDAPQKMCANSAQGQHIHLILNDAPYAAKYEASFDYDVPDGDHYLLAFLSRSYHESIKTDRARIAQKVTVKDKAITDADEIDGPMLFYSRPKGTYVGEDAERIMLDFYLVNCDLGENFTVKAKINEEEYILKTWKPHYVDGLPMGENTIELSLLDAEGNLADVPLNPVSRRFTLKEDPAEQAQ